MKVIRLCIVAITALGMARSSQAGWHGGGGGGWHGGGSWHGGGYGRGGGWYGGGPYFDPGYYYAPYPYYYGNPYYYGDYQATPVYDNSGVGAGSIAVPVQEELTRRGYYHGPVDGVVGPGTRAAISAYQRNHGLEVNGTIDTPLLRSLRL